MKMLSSVILTLVLFVTLSSIHTADGLKCYRCSYNEKKANEVVVGRQAKPDRQARGKICPADDKFDDSYIRTCPTAESDKAKMTCAHADAVVKDETKKERKVKIGRDCWEIPKTTKTGECYKDNEGYNICPCDSDLCNGASGIKSGLFSLWPAAFIPVVMYSFGVLGSPSS